MITIESHKPEFEKIIEHLKVELQGLRTGRATPALVEGIQVEAYGNMMSVKSVASITVPDSRTLAVEPWDKSLISAVEKAIRESGAGLNPVNDGKVLRIPMPALNEESRKDLIRVMGGKLEESRITIRKLRDEIKTQVTNSEKAKAISEDERFRAIEKLETLVKEYNEKVKKMGEEKEREIMAV